MGWILRHTQTGGYTWLVASVSAGHCLLPVEKGMSLWERDTFPVSASRNRSGSNLSGSTHPSLADWLRMPKLAWTVWASGTV